MIIDFGQLGAEARLEADLCIIGAGAAGITIAREFAGLGLNVVVLESGGSELEPETQALYEGESVGRLYDLDITRLRYFGGSTNHWQGVCGMLDEIDFEQRSWVPHSGWPISRHDLEPFYEEAHSMCRIGPLTGTAGTWDLVDDMPLALNPKRLRYGFRRQPEFPVRFGEDFGSDLEKASNIQVYLHANATNIQVSPDGRQIHSVDVRTIGGFTGRVFARHFVLACGALENARLLLVSHSVERNGVGNRNDLVGRFFMEHPDYLAATVVADDYETVIPPSQWIDGINYKSFISATPEFQAEQGILNALAKLHVVPKARSGTAAARSLYQDLKEGRDVDGLGEKLWRVLADLDDVVWNVYRRYGLGKRPLPPIESVQLRVVTAQSPNPHSRATLSTERDALDMNKIRLDWRTTDMELRTVETVATAIGAEFGRLGLARIRLDRALVDGESLPDMAISYHQMGTTRMAEDEKAGVVDRDCRVHGLENLYIAGSSVFPTSGYMNPTLTIVALALRLANHLAVKLS